MSSTLLTAHSHRPCEIEVATVAVSGSTGTAEPVDIDTAALTERPHCWIGEVSWWMEGYTGRSNEDDSNTKQKTVGTSQDGHNETAAAKLTGATTAAEWRVEMKTADRVRAAEMMSGPARAAHIAFILSVALA